MREGQQGCRFRPTRSGGPQPGVGRPGTGHSQFEAHQIEDAFRIARGCPDGPLHRAPRAVGVAAQERRAGERLVGRRALRGVAGAGQRQLEVGPGARAFRLRPQQLATPHEGQGEVAGSPPPGPCEASQDTQGLPVIAGADQGAHLQSAPLAAALRLSFSRLAEVLGGEGMSARGVGQAGQQGVVGPGIMPADLLPNLREGRLVLPLAPEPPREQVGQQGVRGVENRGLPEGVEGRRAAVRPQLGIQDQPVREVREGLGELGVGARQ